MPWHEDRKRFHLKKITVFQNKEKIARRAALFLYFGKADQEKIAGLSLCLSFPFVAACCSDWRKLGLTRFVVEKNTSVALWDNFGYTYSASYVLSAWQNLKLRAFSTFDCIKTTQLACTSSGFAILYTGQLAWWIHLLVQVPQMWTKAPVHMPQRQPH